LFLCIRASGHASSVSGGINAHDWTCLMPVSLWMSYWPGRGYSSMKASGHASSALMPGGFMKGKSTTRPIARIQCFRGQERTWLDLPDACFSLDVRLAWTGVQQHQGKWARIQCFRVDPGCWWARPGSNRRPLRCKRNALPTELLARGFSEVIIAFVRLEGDAPTELLVLSPGGHLIDFRPPSRHRGDPRS
jgi:hypothetical protein